MTHLHTRAYVSCRNYTHSTAQHTKAHRHLHGADVRIKAGKDDPALAGVLMDTLQDDVQEQVHIKVGGHVPFPGSILSKDEGFKPMTTQRCHPINRNTPITTQ